MRIDLLHVYIKGIVLRYKGYFSKLCDVTTPTRTAEVHMAEYELVASLYEEKSKTLSSLEQASS